MPFARSWVDIPGNVLFDPNGELRLKNTNYAVCPASVVGIVVARNRASGDFDSAIAVASAGPEAAPEPDKLLALPSRKRVLAKFEHSW